MNGMVNWKNINSSPMATLSRNQRLFDVLIGKGTSVKKINFSFLDGTETLDGFIFDGVKYLNKIFRQLVWRDARKPLLKTTLSFLNQENTISLRTKQERHIFLLADMEG